MSDSDSSSSTSTSSWVFVDENATPQKTSGNQFYLNCSKEPVQELSENDLPSNHSDIDSDDGISVISEPEHLKSSMDEFHQTASENEELVENIDSNIGQNEPVLPENSGVIYLKNILVTTSLIGAGVVVVAILIVPYITPMVDNGKAISKTDKILSLDGEVQFKQTKFNNHRKHLKNSRERNSNLTQDSDINYNKPVLRAVEENEKRIVQGITKENNDVLKDNNFDKNSYQNSACYDKHLNYKESGVREHTKFGNNRKLNKRHFKKNQNKKNKRADYDINDVFDDEIEKRPNVNGATNEEKDKLKYEGDDNYCKCKYKKRQKQLDAKQEYLSKKEEYLIKKEYGLIKRELLMEKLLNNPKHLNIKSKIFETNSESKDDIKLTKKLQKRKRKSEFELNTDKNHKKLLRKMDMDKKNNTKNGIWYSQMREGREDIRRQHHLSDWFFDRSSVRSKLRNKARWYFELMNGREEKRENGFHSHRL